MLDRDQLKTQYDTENVFFKFDEDCSGTLEAREIFSMFEANDIEVSFDAIKELFDMVDKNRTGKLDITKFKSLANNSKAKHTFNQLIKKIRKERHR